MSGTHQKNEQPQAILQNPNLEQIKTQENQPTPQLSDHISKYNSIMGESNRGGEKGGLVGDEGWEVKSKAGFKKLPSIKILPQYNLQTLFIDVHYGKQQTTLSILFVNQYSHIHTHENENKGNYGYVYKTKILDQDIAVKCLKYSNKQKSSQNFEQTLINVVVEIVIMLKASSLKAGPYYPEQLAGFHLIIYKECMQFMMESCKMPAQMAEWRLKSDLKQNLRLLHQNNIIHFDIKPQNISFSKKYNRYVFLDYGLSQIVEEELGFLTHTKFRGTFGNSIGEMRQLYINKNNGWIDLYYNDAYCLKRMFQVMMTNQVYEQSSQRQDFEKPSFVKQHLQHYLIILKRIFLSQQLKYQDLFQKATKHKAFLDRLRADNTKIIQYIMSSMNFDIYEPTSLWKLLKSPDNDFDYTKYRLKRYFRIYKQHIRNNQGNQEFDQSFLFYHSCYAKINLTIGQVINLEKHQKLRLLKLLSQAPSKINKDKLFQEPYLSIFTEACNATSKYTLYSQKLNRLQVFLRVLKVPTNEKDQNQCFVKVLYYCLTNFPMTYEVFNSVIISVAVLDLISHQQFTELIYSIQPKQLDSTQKLKVIFSILSALYWVYSKIRTKLNYYQLMNSTLCQLRLVLSKMTCNNHFELTLKQQFQFLSKIIVQTQYLRKKEETAKVRKEFKQKIQPTLSVWAVSNVFLRQLLQFMRLTLTLKRFERSFQQQTYLKYKDQNIFRCSNMLITKRKFLAQNQSERFEASECFFYYFLYEDFVQFHLFQKSQYFQVGLQKTAEVPTFFKRSALSLKQYHQLVKNLVQLVQNASLIDKIEIISVSLCKYSSLIRNRHLLDLSELVSLIQGIVQQIPDLVLSQNMYIKHITPIYLKSCFKLLEIQSWFQVYTKEQIRMRRRGLISMFQEGTKDQRCLKCKVQKLFYLSIQNLRLLAESQENELFLNALIAGIRFCLENSYLFELIHSLFSSAFVMSKPLRSSFMEVISQMLCLADFKNYDLEVKYQMIDIIMRCYKHLVILHSYEQASRLCLKLFDYLQYTDYKDDITGLIASVHQSFQGSHPSSKKIPNHESRRFKTSKFAIKTKPTHPSNHALVWQHLQVCNLLLPSKNKFLALLLTATLRLVHNYSDLDIKVKLYLSKIAYSLNQLDMYTKDFVLGSYYLFHFLAGQNRSQRKTDFILTRVLKSRNIYSNFKCVLRIRKKGEGHQKKKGEGHQKAKRGLARKVKKLNSHCYTKGEK